MIRRVYLTDEQLRAHPYTREATGRGLGLFAAMADAQARLEREAARAAEAHHENRDAAFQSRERVPQTTRIKNRRVAVEPIGHDATLAKWQTPRGSSGGRGKNPERPDPHGLALAPPPDGFHQEPGAVSAYRRKMGPARFDVDVRDRDHNGDLAVVMEKDQRAAMARVLIELSPDQALWALEAGRLTPEQKLLLRDIFRK